MLSPSHKFKRHRTAFSLVELLVTLAVIGLLVAIIVIAFPNLFKKTDTIITTSNLRQILAANTIYANEHNGDFPPFNKGSDQETARLRHLYYYGYLRDPDVFMNPTNEELSSPMAKNAERGAWRGTTFTSRTSIYTKWSMSGGTTTTPSNVYDNPDVPLYWDFRADRLGWNNKVILEDGRKGGHFAYFDGEVRLIGPPENVIRGQPNIED